MREHGPEGTREGGRAARPDVPWLQYQQKLLCNRPVSSCHSPIHSVRPAVQDPCADASYCVKAAGRGPRPGQHASGSSPSSV